MSNVLFLYNLGSQQKLKPDAELKAFILLPDIACRDCRLIQVDHDHKSIVVGRRPSSFIDGNIGDRAGNCPDAILVEKSHLIRAIFSNVVGQCDFMDHVVLEVGSNVFVDDIEVFNSLSDRGRGKECSGDEDRSEGGRHHIWNDLGDIQLLVNKCFILEINENVVNENRWYPTQYSIQKNSN